MPASSVSKFPHESNEHKTCYNNNTDPDNRTEHVFLIEETFRRLNSIVLVGTFTLEKEKMFTLYYKVINKINEMNKVVLIEMWHKLILPQPLAGSSTYPYVVPSVPSWSGRGCSKAG